METLMLKKCTRCLNEKSLNEFTKNKNSKDGLDLNCKECRKYLRKRYRESEVGKQAIHKQYWDNIEKERERGRKKSGTPEYLAYQKNYREKNKDIIREQKRKWNKEREVYYKVRNHVKFAKDKGLFNEWDEERYLKLMEKHGDKCCLTGETDGIQIDHFVAIDTGHCGTYEGNMIPLTRNLNSSKSNKNPFVWIGKQAEEVQLEFEKVVKVLAEENGLTPNDFRGFVNWCYDNPRSEDDIKFSGKFNSIDVWKLNNKVKG